MVQPLRSEALRIERVDVAQGHEGQHLIEELGTSLRRAGLQGEVGGEQGDEQGGGQSGRGAGITEHEFAAFDDAG